MSTSKVISEHERFRRLRGWTVVGLARKVGRSHTYVSRIEHGHVEPSPGYRRDVAAALGVPEELIFGEGPGPP